MTPAATAAPPPPEAPPAPGSPADGPLPGRRRRPLRLRTKLIAAAVLLVLLVCGVTGVATQLSLTHYLTSQVDQRLQPFAQDRPQDGDGSGPFDFTGSCTGVVPPDRTPGRGGPGFTDTLGATLLDGRVVTAGLLTRDGCVTVSADAAAGLTDVADQTRPVTVTIDGYGDFRVLGTTTGGTTTVVGLPLAREQATAGQLVRTLLIVMATALLVAAAGAYVIVRRTLRPLDRVAATAHLVATMPLHRGEVDLGIRVPPGDTDPRTEVGQVGAALNRMLGHVSTALERRQASETQVRRFVADASHELRTPLAAIRGYTELARRGDVDRDTVAHALSRVDSESVRMSVLVDDLLLLARLDAGRPPAADEVDLTLLALDVVSDARVAGPEHVWRLDLPAEPVAVTGEQLRLHQVLANLLTNARTHTPPGTTVTTGVALVDGEVQLTVTDDGPGIDPALLPGVFGRFVRGDSSRSRQAGSTGLGLAIVRAVVTAHGGRVEVDSRPGRTRFTVSLPPHGSDPVSPPDARPAPPARG
ncbi:sensor histidine kinase [Nakamurella deserti]|uniref:sensor histidine kinase n=1 Tax=Nakamurella deserti TaxID=2164074 RepID=UPI000DBE3D64|nr:HAMP domain-containing sensor histidine kinase [Nakamurella deserti]